ncbi:MAG: hypothetical protein KME05_24240 [Gloeocapsa sp. UFS-A4-WI-NPMV-4B04]|nr:hypothetical protein [Gloeocapsa sp. UFS-A4-WI-NPMV-4B04]
MVSTTVAVITLQVSNALAEYSFTVENSAETLIEELLVSEDGENWGHFDIGSGIAPGETGKLVWDKNTDDQSCSQFIKAVYADGSYSQPTDFDFCQETDLVFEK